MKGEFGGFSRKEPKDLSTKGTKWHEVFFLCVPSCTSWTAVPKKKGGRVLYLARPGLLVVWNGHHEVQRVKNEDLTPSFARWFSFAAVSQQTKKNYISVFSVSLW